MQFENKLNIRTIIHICSAHSLHNLHYKLEIKFKLDKNFKKCILYIFGKIIKSYDFVEVGNIFKCFCKVLPSPTLTPEVIENISTIENYVKGKIIEQAIIDASIADRFSGVDYESTYKDQSPFGRYFTSIYKDINTDIVIESDRSSSNQLYFPSVIEYLITYYMPILPLWSNLLFDSLENDPLIRINAVVENWNRILKRTIMKSATMLRPGNFIRKLYPKSGRVLAFNFGLMPIANKLFSVRKQKRAIPDANECEEVWKKRKLNKKNYLKTSDISKYTVPLKVVDERPRSKIKYRKRQTLRNLMMVSKLNKNKQELLVKNEPLLNLFVIIILVTILVKTRGMRKLDI